MNSMVEAFDHFVRQYPFLIKIIYGCTNYIPPRYIKLSFQNKKKSPLSQLFHLLAENTVTKPNRVKLNPFPRPHSI